MFEWLVKKVLVGKINDLLKVYEKDVGKVKATLEIWIGRLEKVLSVFKSVLAKLDDNRIDADELKQASDEVEELIRKW